MAKKELEIQVRLKDLITKKITTIKRGFNLMARSARSALRRLSRTIFNLKSALAGLGIALVTKAFVRAAADIQKYRVQLTAIYGDAKKAAKTLFEIRQFAAESPLQTKDVIEGFKRLEAVGIESAENVIKKLGNVALIFDREVAEVANAFIGLNKRTLRELGVEVDRTGQHITIAAGKGAKRMIVEIEKAGKNTIQLNKEIRDSLLNIWTKQFPDAMELAGNTFDAKVAVFKSKIFDLMADIGEIYLPKIEEWITRLSDFLTSHHNEIVAFFTSLPAIWDVVIERLETKLENTKKKIKTGFWDWLKKPLTMWGEIKGVGGQSFNELIDGYLGKLKKGEWTGSYHIWSKEEIPIAQLIADIIDRQANLLKKKNEELKKSVDLQKAEKSVVASATTSSIFTKMTGDFSKGVVDEFKKITKGFQNMESVGKRTVHNLTNGVKNSFSTMFKDLIRGTKSVGDAFVDMGNRILDVFAQIAAEFAAEQAILYAMKGLSGIGGFFSGLGKATPGFVSGSTQILPNAPLPFADGGIVHRPTLAMVGEGRYNEAVVPLPDGNSIPVQMTGGQGGVTINPVIVVQAVDARDVLKHENAIMAMFAKALRQNKSIRGVIQSYV